MDGAITPLLVVGAICLVILAWAGRKRFPLRIGAGNFFRRKTQVAIVVAGLLIGTAIISSSFIIQTTFDYTVRSAVFRALDAVDEIVFVASPDGSRVPFSEQVWTNLQANLTNMPNVVGLAPRFQLGGAVVDPSTRLFDPTTTLIGFDPAHDLGRFFRADGSAWDGSGLGASEAVINGKLATGIEAKAGDTLILNIGGPRGFVRFNVTVREIVQDVGRGAWNDGENLFLPLSSFQAALGENGQINTITVANVGGVTQGYLRSDDVVREMAALLASLVGTFVGLLVAAVILWGFSQVFGAGAFGGTGFILSWTDSDLINGFAIGFLITMATIAIASWRVSKLNIVRAIRDIPEPVQRRSTRRQVALGAAIAILGGLGLAFALARQSLLLQDLGPTGLAFGLAVLTMRVVPPRAVFTAAGLFIVGWVLSPWKFFGLANADITLFIAAGLLLVFGGLLVVLFNSDSILALATRLVRRRTC